MLEASEVIAFAAAADLRQARAFYEQVLGLRVIAQNDFACVFDANGTMLRVTAVAGPGRA
jgi:catechol 2,3-dioxygenase-like lactoylglutathione lyase family enzyme